MVPMPPPETVLEMPKSVPEKLGARSTWLENICSKHEHMNEQYFSFCNLAMWPADRAPLHHIPSTCGPGDKFCVYHTLPTILSED